MFNWLEYKDPNGNSYYACGYCNNTVWERSDKCPFCGAPMNYKKASGGRRFLSWLVLVVLDYLAMVLVSFFAKLAIGLGQNVYENYRTLFWIVIALGGTFGLGFIWLLVWIVPAKIVELSEKVAKTRKGLRYFITGGVVAALYTIDIFYGLATQTYNVPTFIFIINHIVWIFLNIIIIYFGYSVTEE